MAVEFKAQHTRSSEYLFRPEEITVKPEFNGRYNLPEIDSLIQSFLSVGQLQPVLVGNDGGHPVLYAGHRRWRAALEINKQGLAPQPFKLRCVYYRGDEKSAFLATITENHERKATDEIDDAHNIAKLEQIYGMSHEEIAAVYREDVAFVKQRLALLDLSKEAEAAFRSGQINSVSAAVAIAKLSKDAQRDRIRAAGDGKITAAAVKAPAESNGLKKPNVAAIRDFWKPYAEREDNKPMTRFAKAQAEWLKSGDTEAYFKAVADILGERL